MKLFPFSSNQEITKSLQQCLKLLASELDYNEKSTFSHYSILESLHQITLNDLVKNMQEIPESNSRELYNTMTSTINGITFYHIMAVVESYRTKVIPEEAFQSPL